jgi:hypothetical protein
MSRVCFPGQLGLLPRRSGRHHSAESDGGAQFITARRSPRFLTSRRPVVSCRAVTWVAQARAWYRFIRCNAHVRLEVSTRPPVPELNVHFMTPTFIEPHPTPLILHICIFPTYLRPRLMADPQVPKYKIQLWLYQTRGSEDGNVGRSDVSSIVSEMEYRDRLVSYRSRLG